MGGRGGGGFNCIEKQAATRDVTRWGGGGEGGGVSTVLKNKQRPESFRFKCCYYKDLIYSLMENRIIL